MKLWLPIRDVYNEVIPCSWFIGFRRIAKGERGQNKKKKKDSVVMINHSMTIVALV